MPTMHGDRPDPGADRARTALEEQARRERHPEAPDAAERPDWRSVTQSVTNPAGGVTVPPPPTAASLARAQLHERIERDFVYHPPSESARIRYAELRERYRALAHLIVDSVPPGRELSTALTLLEQSNMMANAGIARSPL